MDTRIDIEATSSDHHPSPARNVPITPAHRISMNQSTGSNKPYPYPSYGKMMHDGFNGLLTSITGKALPQTRMGRVRAPTRITGSTNTELREIRSNFSDSQSSGDSSSDVGPSTAPQPFPETQNQDLVPNIPATSAQSPLLSPLPHSPLISRATSPPSQTESQNQPPVAVIHMFPQTQSQGHLRPTVTAAATAAQPSPLTQLQDQPCSTTTDTTQLTPQTQFRHLHPIIMTPTQTPPGTQCPDQLCSTMTDITQMPPQTQSPCIHSIITPTTSMPPESQRRDQPRPAITETTQPPPQTRSQLPPVITATQPLPAQSQSESQFRAVISQAHAPHLCVPAGSLGITSPTMTVAADHPLVLDRSAHPASGEDMTVDEVQRSSQSLSNHLPMQESSSGSDTGLSNDVQRPSATNQPSEGMVIDDGQQLPTSAVVPSGSSMPSNATHDSSPENGVVVNADMRSSTIRPHYSPDAQPGSSPAPIVNFTAIQRALHTISQQNATLTMAMQVVHETLLQVPSQLQPVTAAALEQALAARGVTSHSGIALSPTVQRLGSGTAPPITNAAAGQYDGDSEGTIEGDINLEAIIKSKQAARKDKKKTPMDNLYNDCLRQFLEDAGVKQKKRRSSPLPRSATSADVNTYEGGGGGGPVYPGILLNWSKHLTEGSWNRDAIILLAVNARIKLKEHQPPFSRERLEQDFIQGEIVKKLRNTKLKVNENDSLEDSMLPDVTRKITEGCRSLKTVVDDQKKRRMVRKHMKIKQRRNIINENKYRDPPTWSEISTVVEALDAAGMSGEETENDTTSRAAKRMVVLKIPWLSQGVTELLHSVDTYATAIDDECFKKSKRGNPGFAKSTKTGGKKPCRAVRMLPSNWYDKDWYGGLSDAQKASLLVLPERALPQLDDWVRSS